ncbi:SPOR domain-containing protein [Photobacterium sp. CCB-ST2H9]|uniref:SPOR domain-containing protein n=1 Tax=Photobacterium sp. CCB-ST2H9 TaxID=2912855 RepID=UPI0020029E16|nr:SPOR domain-containing protein [Photobacterium sp. CCB-ST2H9]UTM56535.1 SPOR domain-containing protein [Photobacterium sp. CCB-ST2H9]
MASKFQSRLVGTIVLVAIGVIFLPDFFDGKKQHFQEQFASIPLQPQTGDEENFTVIPEPVAAEAELPPMPVTEQIAGSDVHSTVAEPVKVKPQPVGEPQAGLKDSGWVIQLGVFRNFDNAHQLVEKLRSKGYQAHVWPKDLKPGDLARVVVGPEIDKTALSGKVDELRKLTGLNGQLLRFNPLNP